MTNLHCWRVTWKTLNIKESREKPSLSKNHMKNPHYRRVAWKILTVKESHKKIKNKCWRVTWKILTVKVTWKREGKNCWRITWKTLSVKVTWKILTIKESHEKYSLSKSHMKNPHWWRVTWTILTVEESHEKPSLLKSHMKNPHYRRVTWQILTVRVIKKSLLTKSHEKSLLLTIITKILNCSNFIQKGFTNEVLYDSASLLKSFKNLFTKRQQQQQKASLLMFHTNIRIVKVSY